MLWGPWGPPYELLRCGAMCCVRTRGAAGKKSKEEAEKAAVEQEALTKVTTVLEAGAPAVCVGHTHSCTTGSAASPCWQPSTLPAHACVHAATV